MHGLEKIAEENAIELIFEGSEETKVIVTADYDKIYESVYNVVVNAIKYTPEGGHVTASVTLENKNCVIRVIDDGPGIPDSEKTKVFDSFYRLDDSRARDTGGTGLGLAITKEAVMLHGGTIEVLDAESGGSIFKIEIPVNEEVEEKI